MTIDVIYENLMNGNVYGYSIWNVRFPYFNIVLNKHWCKPYFCYSHYGSSAIKINKEKLDWLIRTIFKTTPEEFCKKYECRTSEEIYKEMKMLYKIRCYKRTGDFDHEEYFETLDESEKRRTEWGLSIGLDPEPTYRHFAYYPTIWKWKEREYADGTRDYGYERVMGY